MEKNIPKDDKFKELSNLLKQALDIYQEDRKIALKNYNAMKSQLDDILSNGFDMSEEGKIEAECNKALKLLFTSGERLDGVIQTISKIIMTQLNNETKENIAAQIFSSMDGTRKITTPIDISNLLEENKT